MKKSLLALAVLSSIAGVASAQSSVTVYGLIDAGVTVTPSSTVNGVALPSRTTLDSGIGNGSRLGFKGTEDLGNGLKALFVLEQGLYTDTGASAQSATTFGRQSWVGLQSADLGTVALGRQYTGLYNSLLTLDPFGYGMTGAANNVFNLGGTSSGRQNNALRYTSVNYNGFSVDGVYGFGEVAGNASSSRDIGGTANYVNGPLALLVSYDALKNSIATDSLQTTLFGGSYDFGVVKTSAAFAINKGSSALPVAGVQPNVKSDDFLLGAKIPFGASAILASYINHNDKSVHNYDSQQFAIGYTYALSNRTGLYSSLGYIKNKNGAFLQEGNGSTSAATSASPAPTSTAAYGTKAIDFGIRHAF
jgi:predicted porin